MEGTRVDCSQCPNLEVLTESFHEGFCKKYDTLLDIDEHGYIAKEECATTQICRVCKKEKFWFELCVKKGSKTGYENFCKKCRVLYDKERVSKRRQAKKIEQEKCKKYDILGNGLAKKDYLAIPKFNRKCTKCGRPTNNYKCDKCWGVNYEQF